ncbi:hypothetical protein ACVWW5_002259 [Bradyrhizobium sp. LM3.4]
MSCKIGSFGIDGVVDVYQQMMMAGVLVVVAGMRHAHVPQAEPNQKSAAHLLSLMRGDEIEFCVLGGGLALRTSDTRKQCKRRRERDAAKDLHQTYSST